MKPVIIAYKELFTMRKPAYAESIEIIKDELKNCHGLSEAQAKAALRVAQVERFFRQNQDMAEHDPPEQWADFAYGCWKNRQKAKGLHARHIARGKIRFVVHSAMPGKRKVQ